MTSTTGPLAGVASGGLLAGGGETAGGGGTLGVGTTIPGVGVGAGSTLCRGVDDGRPATTVGAGDAAAVSPVGRGPIGDGVVGMPNVPMASANVARTRFRIPRATMSRARCADVTTIETPRPVGTDWWSVAAEVGWYTALRPGTAPRRRVASAGERAHVTRNVSRWAAAGHALE